MTRWFRMAFGLAVFLGLAGSAEAQGWRIVDAPQTRQVAGHGIKGRTVVSPAPQVTSVSALPPGVFGRRAPTGGLIETAARRVNPFSATSRAWDVSFAPAPYRQGPAAPGYQVARPGIGAPGYRIVEPTTPGGLPTSAAIPGVNCPTCPR